MKGDALEYQQFVQAHNEALLGISLGHSRQLGEIATGHVTRLMAYDPTRLEPILGVAHDEIKKVLPATKKSVSEQLSNSHSSLADVLVKSDAEIWRAAERNIATYGLASGIRQLRNTSPQATSVIRAGLDLRVLGKAKSDISTYSLRTGINDLKLASGEPAIQAMRAAFDLNVYNQAHNHISTYSLRSGLDNLKWASSPAAVSAMRAAIDLRVLRKGEADSTTYSLRTGLGSLKWASGPVPSNAINSYLTEKYTPKQQQSRPVFDDEDEQIWERVRERVQQPPPRAETRRPRPAERPKPFAEVEAIILLVKDAGSNKTLRSEKPADVARVVKTVRLIREKAEKEGKTVTDKEIYIRFRRKIETGEPNPRLLRSTQILLNLMGGKPGGSLPF